jgi:transcriptional regulator
MYVPPHFREDDVAAMHAMMRANPFATLVSIGEDGLPMASHIPMLLEAEPAPNGRLLCHVSRANAQWKTVANQSQVLVMFMGPEFYVTPSWYPTKRDTGKVVPTWNYVTVHAYGAMRAFDDAARLHDLVSRLTDAREAERETPWSVDDAPASYIDGQLRGIVGLEITIDRLLGKWKLSQNKTDADRRGTIDGLRDAAQDELARAMETTL